jgi:hypothetical protein
VPAHDAGMNDADYLMLRELLKQAKTDPAMAAELDRLIADLAPMAEFRELHKRKTPH